MNNLVTRIKRQDPKEVSIYLFHSLSNSVITQLRKGEEQNTVEQARSDKDILIRKIRRTSEEVGYTEMVYRLSMLTFDFLACSVLIAHAYSCPSLYLLVADGPRATD